MKRSPGKRPELNMRKLLLWLQGTPVPGRGPSAGLMTSARFPSCRLGSAPLMSERPGPGSPPKRGKAPGCGAARAAARCPQAAGVGTRPLGLQAGPGPACSGARAQASAGAASPASPGRPGPAPPLRDPLLLLPSLQVPGKQGETKNARQWAERPDFNVP